MSDRDPENSATALVPPDGTRVVSTDDGSVRIREEARLTGPEMVLTSPPLVGGALAALLDGDPAGWRIWRTTLTSSELDEGASSEQSTTLRRLTEDGIEQLANYGAFTLVFDPPLLEIPADVHDGSEWGGDGDATSDGSLTYAASFTAEESQPTGCFHVTGALDLSAGGEPFFTSDTDETWCPDQGIVPAEETEVTTYDGLTVPNRARVNEGDIAAWQVHERRVVFADSVEEAEQTGGRATLSVSLPPAPLADGGLAVVNGTGSDVIGLARSGDMLARAWVGHPGGTITGLATAGSVTAVVTTSREAVAYGDHGQWLWTRRLPDVSLTAPLAVDGDHLVLTTASGDVLVLDPATGEEQWRQRLTDQVRTAPDSFRHVVVVGDVAGHVAAFDLVTGEELWTDDPGPVLAVGEASGIVVTLSDGLVRGYRADDGTRLWTITANGAGGEAVVDLGGTVAVVTDERAVGIDVDDGSVQWRAPGGQQAIELDEMLAIVDDGVLTVRDADGVELGGWTLPGLVGSLVMLAPSAGGLWTADGVGHVVELGP